MSWKSERIRYSTVFCQGWSWNSWRKLNKLLRGAVLSLSKGWQWNTGTPRQSSLCCLGPRAFICWLQFISSQYTAADLTACTFCCHLKGISCHAPKLMYLFVALDSICAAKSRGECEQHAALSEQIPWGTFKLQVMDLKLESELCVEFCKPNLIITEGMLNSFDPSVPEGHFLHNAACFSLIRCALWKCVCWNALHL